MSDELLYLEILMIICRGRYYLDNLIKKKKKGGREGGRMGGKENFI